MPLTPCKTDPNRAKELERRKEDPGSFGAHKEQRSIDRAKQAQEQNKK